MLKPPTRAYAITKMYEENQHQNTPRKDTRAPLDHENLRAQVPARELWGLCDDALLRQA